MTQTLESYLERRKKFIAELREIEHTAKRLADEVGATDAYVPECASFSATLLMSGSIVANGEARVYGHHGVSAVHAHMSGDEGAKEFTSHDHVKAWARMLS